MESNIEPNSEPNQILNENRSFLSHPTNLHTAVVCIAVRNFFLTKFLLSHIFLVPKIFWIKYYLPKLLFFCAQDFWTQNYFGSKIVLVRGAL